MAIYYSLKYFEVLTCTAYVVCSSAFNPRFREVALRRRVGRIKNVSEKSFTQHRGQLKTNSTNNAPLVLK